MSSSALLVAVEQLSWFGYTQYIWQPHVTEVTEVLCLHASVGAKDPQPGNAFLFVLMNSFFISNL